MFSRYEARSGIDQITSEKEDVAQEVEDEKNQRKVEAFVNVTSHNFARKG